MSLLMVVVYADCGSQRSREKESSPTAATECSTTGKIFLCALGEKMYYDEFAEAFNSLACSLSYAISVSLVSLINFYSCQHFQHNCPNAIQQSDLYWIKSFWFLILTLCALLDANAFEWLSRWDIAMNFAQRVYWLFSKLFGQDTFHLCSGNRFFLCPSLSMS